MGYRGAIRLTQRDANRSHPPHQASDPIVRAGPLRVSGFRGKTASQPTPETGTTTTARDPLDLPRWRYAIAALTQHAEAVPLLYGRHQSLEFPLRQADPILRVILLLADHGRLESVPRPVLVVKAPQAK